VSAYDVDQEEVIRGHAGDAPDITKTFDGNGRFIVQLLEQFETMERPFKFVFANIAQPSAQCQVRRLAWGLVDVCASQELNDERIESVLASHLLLSVLLLLSAVPFQL
jgi:hypothetical protein